MPLKFSSNLSNRHIMNNILSATAQNLNVTLTEDHYRGFWSFCDQIDPSPTTNDQLERLAEYFLNG